MGLVLPYGPESCILIGHVGWEKIDLMYLFALDVPYFFYSNIDAAPVGLSRSVKKIMKHKVPDLGSLTDISEFVTGYNSF